jgi:hypothetical protein
MNNDGTLHDKKNGEPNLTNTTKEWLGKHGWATEVRLYK